jgi:hypothetical protein
VVEGKTTTIGSEKLVSITTRSSVPMIQHACFGTHMRASFHPRRLGFWVPSSSSSLTHETISSASYISGLWIHHPHQQPSSVSQGYGKPPIYSGASLGHIFFLLSLFCHDVFSITTK